MGDGVLEFGSFRIECVEGKVLDSFGEEGGRDGLRDCEGLKGVRWKVVVRHI